MRMKVITHQAHSLGFWVGDLKQVSDLMGPVHSGPMLGYTHTSCALERLHKHEDVRRPIPFILVIHLPRLAWGSGERLSGLFDELDWLRVHTDQGDLRIVGQRV